MDYQQTGIFFSLMEKFFRQVIEHEKPLNTDAIRITNRLLITLAENLTCLEKNNHEVDLSDSQKILKQLCQ